MPVSVANADDLGSAPQVSVTPDTSPASLEVQDLVVGTGTEAGTGDTVSVQYHGVHIHDGNVFDSSWNRGGSPVSFPLGQVIPGFRDGIGSRGAPPAIGPNEPLVFVVDLVKVR